MDTKTQARKLAEKIYRYMEPRAQLLTERPIQHIASLIEAVLEEAENRGRTDFRFIDIQRSIEQAVAAEREKILKFLACAEIPGCWNWKAAKNTKGYGQFGVDHEYAHRISYEMFVGPIPEGLVIDHICRNPSCINPSHLRPLTNRENVLIGTGCVAKNYRKSHCDRGHEFTPENTKHYKNTRVCRICVKTRNDGRYQAKAIRGTEGA